MKELIKYKEELEDKIRELMMNMGDNDREELEETLSDFGNDVYGKMQFMEELINK